MGFRTGQSAGSINVASIPDSGKRFNIVPYGPDENEEIDYAEMERLAHEHKPKLIIAGASAYALEIDF